MRMLSALKDAVYRETPYYTQTYKNIRRCQLPLRTPTHTYAEPTQMETVIRNRPAVYADEDPKSPAALYSIWIPAWTYQVRPTRYNQAVRV